MSILTGPEIERLIRLTRRAKDAGVKPGGARKSLPWIDVEPYTPACVGPNSVDVHLGPTLLAYDMDRGDVINPENPPETLMVKQYRGDWQAAWLLKPGILYLGATAERIECHGVVPWIDGRSSVGRLGVSVHVTAGRGDDGWPGPGREPAPFTLEITVVHPTILRPGMRLAQLTFMSVEGERKPYAGRYCGATGPEASKFHAGGGR